MEQRLEIASRLLSSLISQDQKRSLGARMYEVHHCLMLADALIANASSLPSLEISATGSVIGGQPVASPDTGKIDVKRQPPEAKSVQAGPTLH